MSLDPTSWTGAKERGRSIAWRRPGCGTPRWQSAWARRTRARVADVTEGFLGPDRRPADGWTPAAIRTNATWWFCRTPLRRGGLAGDAGAVGRSVTLEGELATVVGVLPGDFRFHLPAPPWPGFRPKDNRHLPADGHLASAQRNDWDVQCRRPARAGRRRSSKHESSSKSSAQRIAQEHPNPYLFEGQAKLRVVPLHDQLVGGARLALWVMLAAVGLRAADRLRECRQPATGPRVYATPRDRDSRVAGRRPAARAAAMPG